MRTSEILPCRAALISLSETGYFEPSIDKYSKWICDQICTAFDCNRFGYCFKKQEPVTTKTYQILPSDEHSSILSALLCYLPFANCTTETYECQFLSKHARDNCLPLSACKNLYLENTLAFHEGLLTIYEGEKEGTHKWILAYGKEREPTVHPKIDSALFPDSASSCPPIDFPFVYSEEYQQSCFPKQNL